MGLNAATPLSSLTLGQLLDALGIDDKTLGELGQLPAPLVGTDKMPISRNGALLLWTNLDVLRTYLGAGVSSSGNGLNYRGEVADFASLPSSGQQNGDIYKVNSPLPKHLWFWSSAAAAWQDGGAIGIQGEPGDDGTAATVNVDPSVTPLAYGQAPTVSNTGTPAAAVLKFGIPGGAPGDAGEDATVEVDGTDTLEPGQPAEVVALGDPMHLRLRFKIPKGEKGDPGTDAQGQTGALVWYEALIKPNISGIDLPADWNLTSIDQLIWYVDGIRQENAAATFLPPRTLMFSEPTTALAGTNFRAEYVRDAYGLPATMVWHEVEFAGGETSIELPVDWPVTDLRQLFTYAFGLLQQAGFATLAFSPLRLALTVPADAGDRYRIEYAVDSLGTQVLTRTLYTVTPDAGVFQIPLPITMPVTSQEALFWHVHGVRQYEGAGEVVPQRRVALSQPTLLAEEMEFAYVRFSDFGVVAAEPYGGVPFWIRAGKIHRTPTDKQEAYVLNLLQDGDAIVDGDRVFL